MRSNWKINGDHLYQPVPEPSLTILGTGVVLGAIPFLKKGKKDKEKDV
ncbi:hypothetical protein MYAER_1506 [Microcystis aeruginosa NIES-2549]|jgi:hypothetical protein|uniref:Uncharacterized protein n=1 Tax=Microcystis aeruginosa NIES-2549 TaxID=1641812 RepID=A0A0F6RKI9_MICAE|nr:hypothetical protein MYAER_1506 [Microcystis aeruginosa NIES-2549]AOC52248.1 hypothetical protein amyaer_1519 [Microcystis aeruginosa NIES-2481]